MNIGDQLIVDDETVVSMSEASLRREAQQHPDDWSALNNLGIYLSCKGYLSEAQEILERTWQMVPGVYSVGYNLAIVLMKQLNFTRALDIFMDLEPPSDLKPSVALQIGTCLLALTRYDEAVTYLTRASEQLPSSKEAYYNLFKAASQANNHQLASKANATYSKLVEEERLRGYKNDVP